MFVSWTWHLPPRIADDTALPDFTPLFAVAALERVPWQIAPLSKTGAVDDLRRHRRESVLFTTAQTARRYRRDDGFCKDMLLIVGGFITLATIVVIIRVRVPGGVNVANLGWMSAEWLAQRASRPGGSQ